MREYYHNIDIFCFYHSVIVTLGLINSSNECPINTLEIQAFVSGFNMTGLLIRRFIF